MKLTIVALVSVILFQQNHPPVVKIIAPVSAAVNSTISYSISISDKEDGDTKFDEISQNEILLQAQSASNKKTKNDITALHAMMTSNCMNCHAFKSKLIGPSLMEISKRYSFADLAHLNKQVKEGSKGVWGDVVMPTHPELNSEEINKMISWILKFNGEKSVEYYLGSEGVVQLEKPGPLLLTASYLDHHKAMGEDNVVVQVK